MAVLLVGDMVGGLAPGLNPALAQMQPLPSRAAATTQAGARASLFDPARHMRVSEVRRGMKGYGLTVFHGTQVERFNVEVVDVVKNFNPGFSAVLITCDDERLKHYGAVQGMSGSPIFLTDENGKDRMLGAFAFGWPLGKDPLVGVQPIEYMLDVVKPTAKVTEPVALGGSWDYRVARSQLLSKGLRLDSRVNLAVSGISPKTLSDLSPALRQLGIGELHASMGSAGGVAEDMSTAAAKIEPGSSLVVPIMTGDIELSALGTCTEVIGDRVYAFGHPFENSGEIELPMAAGWVNTIVGSLSSSFKLGASTQTLGVLRSDTACGVGGTFGGQLKTVPISVRVVYDDGSVDRTLTFQAASHPRMTALADVMAVMGSLSAERDLPPQHTLSIESTVKYDKPGLPKELKLGNVFSDASPQELLMAVGLPIALLADSPFGRAIPVAIDTTVRVSKQAKIGEITAARASRARYRAGETVTIFADYTKYGGVKGVQQLSLPLPSHLPPGDYSVVVSDASRFLQDEAMDEPQKMFADTLAGAMAVVQEQSIHKSDRWYLRLVRDSDGVAIGRVGLPKLPGTKKQILMNSARPNLSTTSSSLVVEVPAEVVLSGSAELTVTVVPEPGVKAKPANPNGPPAPNTKPPPPPAAEPLIKPDEGGIGEH